MQNNIRSRVVGVLVTTVSSTMKKVFLVLRRIDSMGFNFNRPRGGFFFENMCELFADKFFAGFCKM